MLFEVSRRAGTCYGHLTNAPFTMMKPDDLYQALYKALIDEELVAVAALRRRIKAKPYLDQLRDQYVELEGLPRLMKSLDHPTQARIFTETILRQSLLLREKVQQLLTKHGAKLEKAD